MTLLIPGQHETAHADSQNQGHAGAPVREQEVTAFRGTAIQR